MHIVSPFHEPPKERASLRNDFNTASLVWFAYYTGLTVLSFAEIQRTVSFHACPCSDASTWTPQCYLRPAVSVGQGAGLLRPWARHSRPPAPSARDGGAQVPGCPWTREIQPTVELGLGSLGKPFFLNSCALFFQRTWNINFPEGFENAIIAQSSGFCFIPCPLFLSTK